MASLPEEEKDEKKEERLMADGDMDQILAEIEKQPLVSDKRSLDLLLKEFRDHANFTRQMSALISEDQHSSYRQMRRDGNCFYRAFLLGLFETIESNHDLSLLTRVSEYVMTSLHRCLKFGYEAFTIEDFYYAFMDELQFYQRKLESVNQDFKSMDGMGNSAIERMANKSHAQYLIFWARMMASLYMRENEKEYAPFIPQDKGGFASWLRADVEALNSEADHLQTVALSRSIQVPITIYCLENITKGGPQKVYTMEGKGNKSCYDLLFRPGHYDVLYRKDGDNNECKTNEMESTNNTNDVVKDPENTNEAKEST
eukprot:224335_1